MTDNNNSQGDGSNTSPIIGSAEAIAGLDKTPNTAKYSGTFVEPTEAYPVQEEELMASATSQTDIISGAEAPALDSAIAAEEPSSDMGDTELPMVGLQPRPPCTTVQQDFELFAPLGQNEEPGIILALPSDTQERTNEAIAQLPNVNIEDTVGGEEWADTLRNSFFASPLKGWGEESVTREGSKFQQAIKSEKGALCAGAPRFNDLGNVLVSGEQAVLRIRALTGLGSIVQIPLWHSGFWLTLKAPSDAALLELNRRIAEEKVTLGRLTHGLAFANTSVFFAGWLMDFALAHTYETTLKPELAGDIRKRISQLDIPIIAWGLACAVWPKGFPYARSVLDPSGNQYRVIKEKVNVGKMLWTDTLSLTPRQIAHMAQRYGSTMTAESLEVYQNEFIRGRGRTIKLDDKVELTLKVPSLEQYLVSGQKWVNNIVTMVDKAFSFNTSGERDQYIMDQGRASNMRQFAHWVESIKVTERLEVRDAETIEQTLDTFSSVDAYRDAYFKEVRSFVEDSTVSLVAIPTTEKDEKSDLPRFPHLLPIDAMSVFFTLLVQRVQRIQART